jgi:hypothetical protein
MILLKWHEATKCRNDSKINEKFYLYASTNNEVSEPPAQKTKKNHKTTELVVKVRFKDGSVHLLCTLLDSGTSATMLLRKHVERGRISKFKRNPVKWTTLGVVYTTKRVSVCLFFSISLLYKSSKESIIELLFCSSALLDLGCQGGVLKDVDYVPGLNAVSTFLAPSSTAFFCRRLLEAPCWCWEVSTLAWNNHNHPSLPTSSFRDSLNGQPTVAHQVRRVMSSVQLLVIYTGEVVFV